MGLWSDPELGLASVWSFPARIPPCILMDFHWLLWLPLTSDKQASVCVGFLKLLDAVECVNVCVCGVPCDSMLIVMVSR